MDGTSKDELASRIAELESDLNTKRLQRAEKVQQAKEIKAEKDKLERIKEELEKSLQAVVNAYNSKKTEVSNIDSEGKNKRYELESLRREFSRLQDQETINEAYLKKVDEFKAKCLDSAWRKENRNDGLGALEHQIDGAVHLAVTGQALLGDKRGLGKTLTALITTDLRDSKKVICVVPSDAVDNFIREVLLWTPHRTPIKLSGMSKIERDVMFTALKKMPEYLLVLNYETWKFDEGVIESLVALQADTFIVDEFHNAKTVSTLQGRGIQKIRYGINTCPRCDYPKIGYNERGKLQETYTCWCGYEGPLGDFCSIKTVIPMSGTFILNKPQELFPALRLVDIKNFNNQSEYLNDFCVRIDQSHWTWKPGGEEALLKRIGPRYIARTQESAGVIIPPVEPVYHTIAMSELKDSHPEQWKAYQDARYKAQLAFSENQAMSMMEEITILLRLRQILVWPADIKMDIKDDKGNIIDTLSLDIRESWKIDKAEKEIRELNEEGERVIVFSQFRGGLHELGRRLGSRSAIYDGSTSKSDRNDIQLDFDVKTKSASPRWDNVLCNYKSAGEALNFQSAGHMIMIDRQWNPGKEGQAIGRMQRLGQTKDTYVHHLAVGNSVDTWLARIIEEKAELIDGFESRAELMQSAYDALRSGDM